MPLESHLGVEGGLCGGHAQYNVCAGTHEAGVRSTRRCFLQDRVYGHARTGILQSAADATLPHAHARAHAMQHCCRLVSHASAVMSMLHGMRQGSPSRFLRIADFGGSQKARLETPGSCRDA